MQNDTRAPVLTNRVRERRKALGLTQEALAERVGVSRQTVIRIESQEQYDVAKLLCLQLARALDVEESWLFVERSPDEVDLMTAHRPEPTTGRREIGGRR